ncbi:multidrug efflux system outer membrane protein [Litorimonas taeanensis]|uniref:Multidrug efflux system outer membrane protein n=1 Tax=Litorimonas taeanensis TaxID=568099 RepID=A0A420WDQ3_9PROT|nr:TolC family protein [Litorimonas taeanensis]RKQ69116.1 multidrug efflux system outer membrane protein [Litorimonas taeanensis]
MNSAPHIIFSKFYAASLTGLALTLSACATPSVPPKPEFTSQIVTQNTFANAVQEGEQSVPDWWSSFDDPILESLVDTALRNNRNIDVAAANLRAADALVRAARLGKSYSTSTSVGADLGRSTGANNDVELNLSGGIAGSWEYDAFDRIESQIKAAEYNRESVLQAQRDIAVLVAAQTAQAYVDLRGAQQRLAVAQQNAELQAEALSLIQELVDNGRSSDLDLHRSETLYRTTLASLPLFQATIQVSIAQLAALTGVAANEASSALPELTSVGQIPSLLSEVATGSPQDLINRRPDIRQAEAEISRRLALSDVERARLFPRIVFNTDISALFNGANRLDQLSSIGFGLGPTISWEGPDLRAVRADIDISDAQTEAAISQYEQTLLTALSDVEMALARYGREMERREDLEKASHAAKNALELARLRFDEGYDDFLDVLDAQRTLLDAEDDRVQNEVLVTTYAISAYRALGGMWTEEELSDERAETVNSLTN